MAPILWGPVCNRGKAQTFIMINPDPDPSSANLDENISSNALFMTLLARLFTPIGKRSRTTNETCGRDYRDGAVACRAPRNSYTRSEDDGDVRSIIRCDAALLHSVLRKQGGHDLGNTFPICLCFAMGCLLRFWLDTLAATTTEERTSAIVAGSLHGTIKPIPTPTFSRSRSWMPSMAAP